MKFGGKPRIQFLILAFAAAAVTVIAITFNAYHYAAAASSQTAAIGPIAEATSFSGALAWARGAGYLLMFVAMVIEGPVITAAAAFGAALGYFNIFIVFILSVAGDLVGDFIYYGIGYFGRVNFVEKYGHHIGLTKKRMKHMERLIEEHPKKTLTAIKLAPMLPAPGLMMIGAVRMPFSRYTWMTLLVALPKTILFMLLGYYFGRSYDSITAYFQNGEYFLLVAVVAIVLAFYFYKQISTRISTRLEAI